MHVGQALLGCDVQQLVADHPQIYGADACDLDLATNNRASSPRMWGAHWIQATRPSGQRSIPTRAGQALQNNTTQSPKGPEKGSDKPRNQTSISFTASQSEQIHRITRRTSPQDRPTPRQLGRAQRTGAIQIIPTARGSSGQRDQAHPTEWIIPTQAGQARAAMTSSSSSSDHPHARGAGRGRPHELKPVPRSSPRA